MNRKKTQNIAEIEIENILENGSVSKIAIDFAN